ncbi:MAG: hypothetical protein ABIZ49_02360 [Opitutaceae bacterium]
MSTSTASATRARDWLNCSTGMVREPARLTRQGDENPLRDILSQMRIARHAPERERIHAIEPSADQLRKRRLVAFIRVAPQEQGFGLE